MPTTNQLNMAQLVQQTLPALQRDGMAGFCTQQARLFEKSVWPRYDIEAFRRRTRRATAPLTRVADLIAYNAFYAAAHAAAFEHLLANLPLGFDNHVNEPVSLKIIDYGCGQGLASLVLLDYLHQHWRQHTFDIDLHLIEPSPAALLAAARYTRGLASRLDGGIRICRGNHGLDALPADLFARSCKEDTLHLFSNVLDMARGGYFQLPRLLDRMRRAPGRHICLATSPSFYGTRQGFDTVQRHFPHAQCVLDSPVSLAIPERYTMISMYTGRPLHCYRAKRNLLALFMNNHSSPVARTA